MGILDLVTPFKAAGDDPFFEQAYLNQLLNRQQIIHEIVTIITAMLNMAAYYLVLFHSGELKQYRAFFVYIQTLILIFDVHVSFLVSPFFMLPAPIFIANGFYTFIGVPAFPQLAIALGFFQVGTAAIGHGLIHRHQTIARIMRSLEMGPYFYKALLSANYVLPIQAALVLVYVSTGIYNKDMFVRLLLQYYPQGAFLLEMPAIGGDLRSSYWMLYYVAFTSVGLFVLIFAYSTCVTSIFRMLNALRPMVSKSTYRVQITFTTALVCQTVVPACMYGLPATLFTATLYTGNLTLRGYLNDVIALMSMHSAMASVLTVLVTPRFRRLLCRGTTKRRGVTTIGLSNVSNPIKITT